jgi:hypothetical protein
VRERQHPKLFWVDPGLARAAKRQLGPVAAEERGPLLEGDRRLKTEDGIDVWPLDRFTAAVADGSLWP